MTGGLRECFDGMAMMQRPPTQDGLQMNRILLLGKKTVCEWDPEILSGKMIQWSGMTSGVIIPIPSSAKKVSFTKQPFLLFIIEHDPKPDGTWSLNNLAWSLGSCPGCFLANSQLALKNSTGSLEEMLN